jgi:CDP-glycerol glycerophosphotransferase (TagB/SpsB family)
MKRKRGIWLISERGDEAKDNGYVFFKYLRCKHPEIKAYYVADIKHRRDYDRVIKYKNVIQVGSIKHKLYYLLAKKVITTHPGVSDPYPYKTFTQGIRKKLLSRKYIFLQHGITMNDVRNLIGKEFAPVDLFICGAKPEYEYVRDFFGFNRNEVIYTGFARFDLLYQRVEKKVILLMPTWRKGITFDLKANNNDKAGFQSTDYYKAYQSFINNNEVHDMLRENGYKLIFYPHYEAQKYISCFTSDCPNIIIADKDYYDVRNLLKTSKIMITDYSSVAMDFAYMEKPLIYYQFDKALFRMTHYKEGYFSYEEDGFGPVVETEDEVIMELKKLLDCNGKNSEYYLNKSRHFFPLKDNNNCERIYNAILKL